LEIDSRNFKKAVVVSVVARFVQLLVFLLFIGFTPFIQILSIYPGPGLFFYAISLILIILEVRNKNQINEQLTSYINKADN